MPRGNGITEYRHPKPQEISARERYRARAEIIVLDVMTEPRLTPAEIAQKAGISVVTVKTVLARLKGVCVKSSKDRWTLM